VENCSYRCSCVFLESLQYDPSGKRFKSLVTPAYINGIYYCQESRHQPNVKAWSFMGSPPWNSLLSVVRDNSAILHIDAINVLFRFLADRNYVTFELMVRLSSVCRLSVCHAYIVAKRCEIEASRRHAVEIFCGAREMSGWNNGETVRKSRARHEGAKRWNAEGDGVWGAAL